MNWWNFALIVLASFGVLMLLLEAIGFFIYRNRARRKAKLRKETDSERSHRQWFGQ